MTALTVLGQPEGEERAVRFGVLIEAPREQIVRIASKMIGPSLGIVDDIGFHQSLGKRIRLRVGASPETYSSIEFLRPIKYPTEPLRQMRPGSAELLSIDGGYRADGSYASTLNGSSLTVVKLGKPVNELAWGAHVQLP